MHPPGARHKRSCQCLLLPPTNGSASPKVDTCELTSRSLVEKASALRQSMHAAVPRHLARVRMFISCVILVLLTRFPRNNVVHVDVRMPTPRKRTPVTCFDEKGSA